jgi:hypothetical protein
LPVESWEFWGHQALEDCKLSQWEFWAHRALGDWKLSHESFRVESWEFCWRQASGDCKLSHESFRDMEIASWSMRVFFCPAVTRVWWDGGCAQSKRSDAIPYKFSCALTVKKKVWLALVMRDELLTYPHKKTDTALNHT